MAIGKYTLDWLLEEQENKEPLKFLYFWGHTPSHNEEVGKFIFSQWYESPFEVDEISYLTAEHWMMAQKALLFEDQEIFQKVILAAKPGEAKALGRQAQNFDLKVWEKNRFDIVVQGNIHKFSQHPLLAEYLMNTHPRVLVEASPVDDIWGIGMAQDEEDIHDVFSWKGLNLLGFALMEVREIIMQEVDLK